MRRCGKTMRLFIAANFNDDTYALLVALCEMDAAVGGDREKRRVQHSQNRKKHAILLRGTVPCEQ
jgi:hypothetical protein